MTLSRKLDWLSLCGSSNSNLGHRGKTSSCIYNIYNRKNQPLHDENARVSGNKSTSWLQCNSILLCLKLKLHPEWQLMWSTQHLGPISQPLTELQYVQIMQIRGLQDIRSQAIIKSYHLSLVIGSAPSSVIRDCAGLGRSLIKQMAQKFTIQELQLMVSSMLFPLGYFHCGQH